MKGVKKMEGVMVVYEIENRGTRKFVIAVEEHISGGVVQMGTDQKPKNVVIEPGAIAKVTEACGEKLTKGWKNEVKLIRKSTRKD